MKKILTLIGSLCLGASIFAQTTFTSSISYESTYANGDYTILSNSAKTLSEVDRPLIVVEGFDTINEYTGMEVGLALSVPTSNILGEQLKSVGYDIIVLNFANGGDYIQRNAFLLIELINRVNSYKQSNEKLVIFGISMGGLVARYALTYMENHSLAHNTRLYVSIDAPHQGANIPLSLQFLLNKTANYFPPIKFMLDDVINSPAARQMLLVHHAPTTNNSPSHPYSPQQSSLRTDLMNELESMGNFPVMCRKIAISNGSKSGLYQKDSLDRRTGDGKIGLFFQDATLFNSVGMSLFPKVYDEYGVEVGSSSLFHNIMAYDNGIVAVKGYANLETLPGGNQPWVKQVMSEFNKQGLSPCYTYLDPCFIPTVSALALNIPISQWGDNLNSYEDLPCKTPFNAFYAPILENQRHTSLPAITSNWLFDEIISSDALNITSASPFNFGINTSNTVGKSINIKNGGFLGINVNQPTDYFSKNALYANSQPVPLLGSTFSVSTNPCRPSDITIEENGVLQIGDGVRFGILRIRNGSQLIIKKYGRLNIHWGSKLLLDGGSLVFEKDALVNLQDLESVIEIKDGGKIIIGTDAKFKWSGTGFIRVNTSLSNFASNVVASSLGNRATFEQRGVAVSGGFNQKLIEVTNGSLSVDANLNEFKLIGGKVLMGPFTRFDVASPMFLAGIKMNANSSTRFSGIWLYGQQNTPYLSSCVIENADVGMRIFTNKGTAAKATIYNTNFINCPTGVISYGKSVDVQGGYYWGCKTGIYVSGAEGTSKVNAIAAYGNRSAIDVVGGVSGAVETKGVNIHNNSAVGTFMVNSTIVPSCSRIYNNYPPANPANGSNILLREYSFLDAEPIGKKDAGRNQLGSDNSNSVVSVGASGFALNKGHSDFVSPNGLTFSGELRSRPRILPPYFFQANENVWNQSGTAPVSGTDYLLPYLRVNSVVNAIISDAAPLGAITDWNICNLQGSWDNWDNGDKPSELIGTECEKVIDGTPIEAKIKEAMIRMHNSIPDYVGAISDLKAVLVEPYTSVLNELPPNTESPQYFEFELCHSIIEFAYRKVKEALSKGVIDGSIPSDGVISDPLQNVIDAQDALKGYYALLEGGHSMFFQVSLDQALIYRLINNRTMALDKIQALRSIGPTEEESALINYYECLLVNEIVIESSQDKSEYLAIDMCRLSLNIPDDEPVLYGERPEDPSWDEVLGKRGQKSSFEIDVKKELIQQIKTSSLSLSTMIVHPNPASSMLFVKLPGGLNALEIRITDIMGKHIQTISPQAAFSELSFPIQLENGLYFIEALNKTSILARQKIMIVK
jgi:hypothetical protein